MSGIGSWDLANPLRNIRNARVNMRKIRRAARRCEKALTDMAKKNP